MKIATSLGKSSKPGAPILVAVIDTLLTISTLAIGFGCIYGVATLALMGLINKDSLKICLSVSCPLITMTALVSPIPVVLDAVQALNAQNLPLQVFQSQAACNILGICYGIQITNPAVLVTNVFGLGMQILYMSGDHYVRNSNTDWAPFALKLSLVFNLGVFVFASHTPVNVLGHFITIFNIVLYAVPLAKLGSILRTRNASSLPTTMICVNVLNNAVWALYALLIEDMVVLLPSVLGFLLSSFQVLVILWCNNGLPYDLSYLLLRARDGSGLLRFIEPEGAAPLDVAKAAEASIELPAITKAPSDVPGREVRPRVAQNV